MDLNENRTRPRLRRRILDDVNQLLHRNSTRFTSELNVVMNISHGNRRIVAEEEVIQVRGRRKRRSAPILRDLSPATLVSIKSPMKRPINEDIAYFLRSPTPKKHPKSPLVGGVGRKRSRQFDSNLEAKLKRTRKSLDADLEAVLLRNMDSKSQGPADKTESAAASKSESDQPKDSEQLDEQVPSAVSTPKTPTKVSINERKKLISPGCRESPRKYLRRSTNV